jgi:O-antigen/teichoic acid export membrane protein
VWTLVGYGGSQALRLLNNLIMWRLLFPEAFGLMALVNVFFTGIYLFSDVGIGPSIVQHDRGDDPTYLNTAWTIQVIREFLVCSSAMLLAGPMAAFYNQPQLSTLIRAAALAALISGFNSTRLFTQTRRISLGRLTALDFASQTAGLVTMIVWAWFHRSIWALIVGSVASNAVRLVLSHTFLPGIRNRFRWDPASVRTLLRFGRWIFVSTMLTFMVMQSDRLVFGKVIPIGMLGVYSIASTWAGMAGTIVNRILNSVLFPLLSRLHSEGTDFSAAYLDARWPWMILAGWASAGMISGGPILIQLLYGARADSAGWIVQALAAGSWFQLLESANYTALVALGFPKWMAMGSAAKLLGMLVLIPLGYMGFGFPGAVVAFASSELLHYTVSILGSLRHKMGNLGRDLALSAWVMLTAGGGLLVARWFNPHFGVTVWHNVRLGLFLKGLAVALFVSIGWGCIYVFNRFRREPTPG